MKKSFILLSSLLSLFFLFSCGNLNRDPDENDIGLYVEAKKFYAAGDLEKTEELLKPLIKKRKFYQARLLMIKTAYFRDDYSTALEMADSLLKDYPQYTDAGIWKVRILFQLNEMEQAEEVLLQLVSFNSENPQVHYLLGTNYENTGDLDKALDYYNRSAAFAEDLAHTYIALGKIYYRFGQKEKALTTLSTADGMLTKNSPMKRPVQRLIEEIKVQEGKSDASEN